MLWVDAGTGEVVARIPAEGAVSLAADDSSVWAVYRELGERTGSTRRRTR